MSAQSGIHKGECASSKHKTHLFLRRPPDPNVSYCPPGSRPMVRLSFVSRTIPRMSVTPSLGFSVASGWQLGFSDGLSEWYVAHSTTVGLIRVSTDALLQVSGNSNAAQHLAVIGVLCMVSSIAYSPTEAPLPLQRPF